MSGAIEKNGFDKRFDRKANHVVMTLLILPGGYLTSNRLRRCVRSDGHT